MAEFLELAVSDICPSPTNPRKTFPGEEQVGLIENVKKHGVLQPILVRPWPADLAVPEGSGLPTYELVAGERRWRASNAAGLETIPAMVRHLTDEEVLNIQVIENLQREGLHPLEEAEGYELMMKRLKYSADDLAEKIDKSKAYIYGRLKLTALCPEARDLFRDGKLSPSTALLIARIPAALQVKAAKDTLDHDGEPLPFRQASQTIQNRYMLNLGEAPFPTTDGTLVPSAGDCRSCPKRSGNNRDLFADVKSADVCTDPECFDGKKDAHVAREKQRAKAQGIPVIDGKNAAKVMPHTYRGAALNEGFVRLDDTNYHDDGHRTYREILGDAAPKPTLLVVPGKKEVIEVVQKQEIEAAMKAQGIALPKHTVSVDHQKKQEAAARKETEFRQALFEALREAIMERDREPDRDDLALLTTVWFSCTWHENQKRLAKLWKPEKYVASAPHDAIQALTDALPTMHHSDLVRVMFDLALIGGVHCNAYNYESEPIKLFETARRFGLDPVALKASMADGGKKKAPPPSKAALAQGDTGAAEGANQAQEAPAEIAVGDTVRVKDDARGPNGMRRKSCGREGTVIEIKDGQVSLKTKAPTVATFYLPLGDVEKVAPTRLQAAQAAGVKYVHPELDLTWSGRGKKPRWVEDFLEVSGNTLEMLSVENQLSRGQASLANEKGTIETMEKPSAARNAAAAIDPERCTKTIDMFDQERAQ